MFASPACVVLCTCPPEAATGIARVLLEEHLVACVNIVPGVRSLYWWEGAITEDGECLLIIKTAAARYEALASRLLEVHPYEVPEILQLAVADGADAYISWVIDSTMC